MTAIQLATKLRSYTKQSSISLNDATALVLLNDVMHDIAELMISRDIKGNYFMVPVTDNLIASQREYAFPDDMLDHMFSLEVAFSNKVDNFSQLPYVKCFPDDFRRFGLARTEGNIQANYTNGGGALLVDAFGTMNGKVAGPNYEIQRRSIYLLSGDISTATLLDSSGNPGAASITNGIRLRYRAYPSDLTGLTDSTTDLSIDPTTTTFGFPKQFHELWARKAAIDWKAQHPGAVPATQLDQLYPSDLEAKLSGIEVNDLSDEIMGRIPYNDGYNY